MSAQLQLDLKPNRRKPARPGRKGRRRVDRDVLDRLGAGLLYWAPVWLPAILLLQVLVGGLRPALAEGRRLEAAEAEIGAWEEELARDSALAEQHRRMLDDDVYRARVERTRRDVQVLLLEDALPADRSPQGSR